MTINARIRVRAATSADLDTIADIQFAAFDDSIINQLIYRNGVSEQHKRLFRSRLLPPPATGPNAEDAAKQGGPFLCVAELLPEGGPTDGPGEVVAFARWVLHRTPRSEEEWNTPFVASVETHGEGCDLSVVHAFIGRLVQRSKELTKGEAMLYLDIIACNPARQRLGAASALMQWGVDLADSLDLPCRLEASPEGYNLYHNFGFEDVEVFDFKITETWGVANTDGSNWGENTGLALAGPAPKGVHRSVIMRRSPAQAGRGLS